MKQKDTPNDHVGKALRLEATVYNVVCTATFTEKLNLEEIAWQHGGEIDLQSFAALKLRIANPKATALVFSTGKIVCTGCSSVVHAKLAVDIFYRMVLTVHPQVRIQNVDIQNLVFSGTFPPLDLPRFARSVELESYYNPKSFPGLFLDVHALAENADRAKVLIFLSGKFVLTGVRSNEVRDSLLHEPLTTRSFHDSFAFFL